MESSAILFALVAVISLFAGLLLGFRQGRAGERHLAEAREAPLREQFEAAKAEVAALKPKAEELTRVTEQLKNEEAKYAQMKADLDTAFKGAAADALRANTQSFLELAKQQLGGQTNEAKLTLEAKELAIKNMLDPLGKALTSSRCADARDGEIPFRRVFRGEDAGGWLAEDNSRVARRTHSVKLRS